MSYVNEFIHTFAGEAALSLLRCMAVANGNSVKILTKNRITAQ